ncbi:hypothetical protein FQA47_012665 [Oryzias melastigma]|uniref:Uncharacterized protein n=1 Tax=Oryzias melastigma TaxID=30732 RepID=A0A834C2D9_ORYME|nr:hypothetical protein FQA47_012665 [Oryzias melastigma]
MTVRILPRARRRGLRRSRGAGVESVLVVEPSLKVMEQCESFHDDPMETNNGQEVNYGHRG